MYYDYEGLTDKLTQCGNDPLATLALLPLRILTCNQRSSRSDSRMIRSDFKTLVKTLSSIYELNLHQDATSCALGLIVLLDPSSRNSLIGKLDFTSRFRIQRAELDFSFLSLASTLVKWYWANDYSAVCEEIICNLIQTSEIDNANDIMRHRTIVADTLNVLVDLNHKKTAEICRQQERYFLNQWGEQAARFYWFYGFSLYVTGNSDQAQPLLKKCSDLFADCEGRHSWTGNLAMVFYHYIGLETDDWDISERQLWNFLDKAERGCFSVSGTSADEIRIHTRYVLLRRHMETQTLCSFLPEIIKYRKECESHQHITGNPRLTVRTAENLLSAYYYEIGDYLNAAHHAMLSLETVSPNNLPAVPSELILHATLLQLYNALNDWPQIRKHLDSLSTVLKTSEKDEEYYRTRVLVQTAQIKLGIPKEPIIQEYRRDIYDRYLLLQGGNTTELDQWGISIAFWYTAMISFLNVLSHMDDAEIDHCEQILRYFLSNTEKFPFNQIQLAVVYRELALLEWAQKKSEAVKTMQTCLRYSRYSVGSNSIHTTFNRVAAELFYDYKHIPATFKLLNEATENVVDGLTKAWQSAVGFLNDHRLRQILSTAQVDFDKCYALLRNQTAAELRYTYVLRFKNLAALAVRERNRILQTTSVDTLLTERIHQIQNRLADAEYEDARQGTDRSVLLQQQLLHLEAEYAKKFPESRCHRDISYEQVAHALSDGEAIVEYYFSQLPCTNKASKSAELELEIFVSTNVAGRTHLHHVVIQGGLEILGKTHAFTGILQNPEETMKQAGRKATLRAELHQLLLAPVLPFLEGIHTVYIAPDRELFNLPFEILYGEDRSFLQDHFRICRIISGRDVLYFNQKPHFNDGCLLLGDPAYGSGEASSSVDHRQNPDVAPVRDLPFSGVEVTRISKYFNSTCCTGEHATKYALLNAHPRRVIHLATHGSFDEDMKTDALYSSCLLFAGYNDWISNHAGNTLMGNGILTADEISRLDLRGTELVVLSACLSGMGDISFGTMQGLLSAFSAAGVHWVVCHIWKANDFATPILMDAFYDAYLHKGCSVPDALQYAKRYLSSATVGELREKGWFAQIEDPRITPEEKVYLTRCSQSIDRRKLFQDEMYWGGFVVYKCQ